ncbi:dihydrodipicolinate synthase family protein [Geochorda subterranea]|uniref:dihydrodipicolinate synthase family protein n=1 Tax=Geochorda subterranea TaxID=3109564 RepID=UPI00386023FF
MYSIAGVVAVLQIPFLPDGEVDWEGLKKIAVFATENGASAVAFGYASEFPKLDTAEREQALLTAVQACEGRVPVVAWCAAESTRVASRLVRRSRELGASMAVVTPPPGAESFAQVRRHLHELTQEGLPLVLQDAPEWSRVHLSVEQLCELCTTPGVIGLKVESQPTWVRVRAVRQQLGKHVTVLGGFGGLYLCAELAAGSDGVMPGSAHPWVFANVIRAFRQGREESALEQYRNLLPYLVVSSHRLDDFIWIQKEILRRLGVIQSSSLRQPGEAPDDFTLRLALSLAERLGLLAGAQGVG